jgi:MHS family proline/betaine transporter-like MFS transporter
VAWLIDRTGSPMVPAWYMLATTIAAIIGVWGLIPHPEVEHERTALAGAAFRRSRAG